MKIIIQISFVEILQTVLDETATAPVPKTAAVLKAGDSLTLEITDQATGEFLTSLLRAMIHAQ